MMLILNLVFLRNIGSCFGSGSIFYRFVIPVWFWFSISTGKYTGGAGGVKSQWLQNKFDEKQSQLRCNQICLMKKKSI